MTRTLLALGLVLCAAAASAEELRVRARESVGLHVPGATAAYAVDASIAELTLESGTIQIRGRRTGMTTVTVITPGDVLTYHLIVTPAPATLSPSSLSRNVSTAGLAGVTYSSDAGRLTSSVSSSSGSGQDTTRLSLTNVTHIVEPSSYARTSLPAASLEVNRGGRRITLLDQRMAPTDLQRASRSVRGIHYRSGDLTVNAGILSTALYRNLLFSPSTSGKLVSGSYRFRQGPVTISPHVTWSSSEPHRRMPSGLVSSVRLEAQGRGGRLRAHQEIGYGGGLAASARLSYAGTESKGSLFGTYLPPGLSRAGGGPPPGSLFGADLSHRFTPRISFAARTQGGRRVLAIGSQRTGSFSSDVRVRVTTHWSVTAGSRVSVFDDDVTQATSVSAPVGVSWRSRRTSASGLFRYQQDTRRNAGGIGWRATASTGVSSFNFRASADYQREVATVSLVFREAPELARLFAELGVAVRTPEELFQFFQNPEYPALADHFERSVATLSPWRLQTRGEIAWNPAKRSDALRFSILNDQTASTRRVQERWLGTLSYTRALTRQLELTGRGTWWLTGETSNRRQRWSYTFGVRARFNGLDGVRDMFRRYSISGHVYSDEAAASSAEGESPLAGVRVVLDGVYETVTGADGRFLFRSVRPGAHRIEAMLPGAPGLRFTTPSIVHVNDSQPVTFRIGRMPARLIGHVRDDTHAPLRGVKLSALCGDVQRTATTDSEGRYSLEGPEGACTVMPDASSLPTGYAASEAEPRAVTLDVVRPARADFAFRAMRSIAGTLPAAASRTVVLRRVEGELVREADAAGRFVFRNLEPGRYVLIVTIDRQTAERTIEVPVKPGVIEADLRPRR